MPVCSACKKNKLTSEFAKSQDGLRYLRYCVPCETSLQKYNQEKKAKNGRDTEQHV